MPQPKDYDDEPRQQIIVKEVVRDANGGFGKLKDGVFFAIVIAVGTLIWTMNQRLTTIEIMVRIIAKKSGIDIP